MGTAKSIMREIYRAMEATVFRDLNLSRDLTVARNVVISGSLTFGDAVVDTMIINGRVATGAVAGSDLTIDATTYQYGEGVEMRWAVTDWQDTYNLSQFQGMYIRTENQEDGVGRTLRAAEFTARDNDVGTGVLETMHCNSYITGATAGKTIGATYGVTGQVEFSSSAGTRTVTTEAVALRGIMLATTGITGLTKMHGLQLVFGDTDGNSPAMGSGMVIQDSSSHSGTCTLTDGMKLDIDCVTGINLTSSCTATDGIKISGACADGIEISGACTAYGINISADCVTGINIEAQTTSAIEIGGATTAISFSATPTYFADFNACSGANATITSDSGSAADTWKARIKIKTDDGTDAWINCYSVSHEA